MRTYGRVGDYTVSGFKDPVYDEGEPGKITGYREIARVEATACVILEDDKGTKTNIKQASLTLKFTIEKFRDMKEAEFEAKLVEKARSALPELANVDVLVLGGA